MKQTSYVYITLVGSENSNRSATVYFAGIVQECVLG